MVKSCPWWSTRCPTARAQLVANNGDDGDDGQKLPVVVNWSTRCPPARVQLVAKSCNQKQYQYHQSKYQYNYRPSSSLLSIPGQKQHIPMKCMIAQYFYVLWMLETLTDQWRPPGLCRISGSSFALWLEHNWWPKVATKTLSSL